MSRQLNDRDLSWLAFNGRVLQEAADPRVPLGERIRFLAIFSSNLDEFYRVRVAALQALLRLRSDARDDLDLKPRRLLRSITRVVERQQEEFGRVFRETILPELASRGIDLMYESRAEGEEVERLRDFFTDEVRPLLGVRYLFADDGTPFLENRAIHLVARIRPAKRPTSPWPIPPKGRTATALIDIPTGRLPRFVPLTSRNGRHSVFLLDDIIRHFLPELFSGAQEVQAWSVKLTRDADLYIDDEFSGDLLEKIREGLKRRRSGPPSRFLHDVEMPRSLLERLRRALDLKGDEIVPGGRYHNFNDFFSFPNLDGVIDEYPPLVPRAVPALESTKPVVNILQEGDVLLATPYQSFDGVVRTIAEAAADPAVTSVSMTLYRVAADSKVVEALIAAARNGKRVTVFVEVKARFDEEANLVRASELEGAGANVIYSIPGLKVHAKLLVIERETPEGTRRHGLFSTGNFNERTALVYADYTLITADQRLLKESVKVFEYLRGERTKVKTRHLLVAPFSLRRRLLEIIDREIAYVRSGKRGELIVKVNSLEDEAMILKLYEAAEAGVEVRMIVRGICRLIPSGKERGKRIEAISIVDRFLEHARVVIARNGGNREVWLASADWMGRNLDRRVEVAFPICDPDVRNQIIGMIEDQLADNSRARLLDRKMRNHYRARADGMPEIRAQERALAP